MTWGHAVFFNLVDLPRVDVVRDVLRPRLSIVAPENDLGKVFVAWTAHMSLTVSLSALAVEAK